MNVELLKAIIICGTVCFCFWIMYRKKWLLEMKFGKILIMIPGIKFLILEELGKRTGHISKSKRVVEVKDNEIIRDWRSARTAAKDLFVSYQTVMDYCNKKVQKPMYNLMWEDDYFNEVFDPFTWEHKK